MSNLLDYSTWDIDTGSCSGFTSLGTQDVENERLWASNPWKQKGIVWQTTVDPNDVTGYGGGFTTGTVSIDPTCKYRFSVYVNRLAAIGERTLFGCNAYVGGTNTAIYRMDGGATTNNPYFEYWYNSSYLNEWLILIGHIHPYAATTPASYIPESGVFQMDGTKLENIDYEWKFNTLTFTSVRMRLFYYDSADKWLTFSDQYIYPRIEKCDGTELSMENLLRGPYPLRLGTSAGFMLPKVTAWH